MRESKLIFIELESILFENLIKLINFENSSNFQHLVYTNRSHVMMMFNSTIVFVTQVTVLHD